MKKIKIGPLVKFSVALVILIALLVYLGVAVCNFLKDSDYFKIKDIVVINNYVDFPTLKGINIFSLNLRSVSGAIQNKCPDQKLVRVSKVMPNRLVIEFQKRVAMAAIRLDKLYFFDNQGILFEIPQENTAADCPIINGLKISSPKLGVKYNLKELDDALRLIAQSTRIGLSKKYPIKIIDVSNPDYLTFSILEGLKIKIPSDNIQDKLSVFSSLISQVNMDLSRVEYIDLRFKDPMIKLKGADEK